ncbi:hypothetical protein EYF80_047635 [Liparis tanakae]|uniref:Uncharacterized protein n=1 Tax=Liparis tanakae TaxID=230148 RepID=A0A4Z2FM27_9TELE|nr:hypothetical protein EYF80_047635 [Liparis tanakae]
MPGSYNLNCISSPALGYPVRAACVCGSMFLCDAAQLHIKAAMRAASFGELNRRVKLKGLRIFICSRPAVRLEVQPTSS